MGMKRVSTDGLLATTKKVKNDGMSLPKANGQVS